MRDATAFPRLSVAAVILSCALLIGACGESTGGKPTVGAIEEKLMEGGAPSAEANCIAKAMHSNLDAKVLNTIMDADIKDPLDALNGLDGEMAEQMNANQGLTLAKAMASCVGLDPGAFTGSP